MLEIAGSPIFPFSTKAKNLVTLRRPERLRHGKLTIGLRRSALRRRLQPGVRLPGDLFHSSHGHLFSRRHSPRRLFKMPSAV